MQSAFGTVVVVVSVVGILGAIAALLLNGRTWDSYSQSHLIRDSDDARGGRPPSGTGRGEAAMGATEGAGAPGISGADAERDEEIRQMLDARNARRRRRGEPEIDVEQEIGRLTRPTVDPALRAEIRQLVIARNHRRVRRGEPPLDVDAEVERQIASLGDL